MLTIVIHRIEKFCYEFGEEMIFNIKQEGRKLKRDESPKTLLKPPAITASGISTIFLPESLNELCDRLKLLIHEKRDGNNSIIIDEEVVVIADKLIQYKSISTKQHEFSLIKGLT